MNLENILWETLRWWASSNHLDSIALHILYSEGNYKWVLDIIIASQLKEWSLDIVNLLIKSYIHIYGENDLVIRDLLFIAVSKMKSVQFFWWPEFHLKITDNEIIQILLNKNGDKNWKNYLELDAIDRDFIFRYVAKFELKYEYQNFIRDSICFMLLTCFELYELKSDNYPLYKWLFNLHFKTNYI